MASGLHLPRPATIRILLQPQNAQIVETINAGGETYRMSLVTCSLPPS